MDTSFSTCLLTGFAQCQLLAAAKVIEHEVVRETIYARDCLHLAVGHLHLHVARECVNTFRATRLRVVHAWVVAILEVLACMQQGGQTSGEQGQFLLHPGHVHSALVERTHTTPLHHLVDELLSTGGKLHGLIPSTYRVVLRCTGEEHTTVGDGVDGHVLERAICLLLLQGRDIAPARLVLTAFVCQRLCEFSGLHIHWLVVFGSTLGSTQYFVAFVDLCVRQVWMLVQ